MGHVRVVLKGLGLIALPMPLNNALNVVRNVLIVGLSMESKNVSCAQHRFSSLKDSARKGQM
jgi:hypothetical protein